MTRRSPTYTTGWGWHSIGATARPSTGGKDPVNTRPFHIARIKARRSATCAEYAMKAHFAGHRGARKYGRYLNGTWIGGDAETRRPHSRWATFKHQIALRLVVAATYARTFASVFVRAALISNNPPARALAPPAAVGWRLAPLPKAPAAASAASAEAADDDSDDDDDDDNNWEGLHAARMAQLMSSRQGSLSSGLPSSASSQGRGFGKGMGGGARGKGKGTVRGIGKVQRPQRAATASARASAAAADASPSASTRAASTRDASTRRRESRAAARGRL